MKTHLFFFAILISNTFFTQKQIAVNQKTAVLVVGNDVGEYANEQLDELAILFRSKNIFVYKFYYPNADWTKIKNAATTCSFFVYNGHGCSNCGLDGEYGGLYVNDFVKAELFTTELHFENSPLVVIQNSCGAAGSSASDDQSITYLEAKNRVTDSAIPYFISGAGAYFATNWMGGAFTFIEDFLVGQQLQEAYNKVAVIEDKVITQVISSTNELNGNSICLGYSDGDFNTAFIGQTGFCLADIHK
jgi:hypothetical protein